MNSNNSGFGEWLLKTAVIIGLIFIGLNIAWGNLTDTQNVRVEPAARVQQLTQPVQSQSVPQSIQSVDIQRLFDAARSASNSASAPIYEVQPYQSHEAVAPTGGVNQSTGAPVSAGDYSPQFLADCAFGQSAGRRVSPRCPDNAAELLGTGR